MLEGCKRKYVFRKVALEMEAAGFVKTAEQYNSSTPKLRLEYRKIADDRNKTGRVRKEWNFFETMDTILGLNRLMAIDAYMRSPRVLPLMAIDAYLRSPNLA